MSDVHVRLNLGRFRLEYSGSLPFFERVVDPLVARVAPAAAPAASAVPGESAGAGEPPASDEPEAPKGYRPPSFEFGQFVQKLGAEAAEPDRQIVAFAFFLWNYAKKDVVTEEEIAGCFRAIGLQPPHRTGELYADLANRLRFLTPAAAAGTWSLTTKGANYVKTRLLGSV
jgi:hypothetical protein